MNLYNVLMYFSYIVMITYYIILISKLFNNDNIQNQFIRFSLKNIYQNHKKIIYKKIKKLDNYQYIFNFLYTTKNNNNDINYDELRNYIHIIIKNNNNNNLNDNIIKDKIIKDYLN